MFHFTFLLVGSNVASMPNFSFLKGVILTLSVGCGGYVVGGVGGVEESTLRLNSAQFQLKLPAGAELGNTVLF